MNDALPSTTPAPFQCVQVAAVVAARFVDRSFQDEGLAAELGMAQNAAEAFQPDMAMADALVAIHARAQRRLRIVGVNQMDMFQAQ